MLSNEFFNQPKNGNEYGKKVSQLSEQLKLELFYCKLGDHSILAKETYLNKEGKRFCKIHRHQVRVGLHGSGYYREGKPSGMLVVCSKPPTLCEDQIIIVNHIAKGELRLKCYCTKQPFKSCLLDLPKKPSIT
jgi:hypothetical protein